MVVAAAFDDGVSGEGYRSILVKTLWLLFVPLQGVDVHDGDDSDGICAGGSVRRMVILSLWSCFGVGAAVGAGVDDGSERLVYSYHGIGLEFFAAGCSRVACNPWGTRSPFSRREIACLGFQRS